MVLLTSEEDADYITYRMYGAQTNVLLDAVQNFVYIKCILHVHDITR